LEEKKLSFTYAWTKASLNYLLEIHEIVSQMGAIAQQEKERASFSRVSEEAHQAFFEKKKLLSEMIDGGAGLRPPICAIGSVPLFLNMVPSTLHAIGQKYNLDLEPINLYTGYGQEGFDLLTLRDPHAFADEPQPMTLFGSAIEGGASHIKFNVKASLIDDIYVGMDLIFTSGPGAHQKTGITSYDGLEQAAQFESTLQAPIGKGTGYLIESTHLNEHLYSIDGSTYVPVASHIWGADNYRSDLLSAHTQPKYQSFTEEESLYRIENDIAAQDFTPYTLAEKKLRRKLQLFDPDYGTLATAENSARMSDVLSQALDQIKTLAVKQKNRIAAIEKLLPKHMLEHRELITF